MHESFQVDPASRPIGPVVLAAATSFSENVYDLRLSKEVQARLFPQVLPRSAGLPCAGICLPAREVGGDLYDFLDLGPGRLGLVIGDVSGKGFAAALQMATLQAQLRTHVSLGVRDLCELVRSVNRLFYDCTPATSYATLVFAEYEERTRILRYVNCGHPPPVILRADGGIERLESSATVLGLTRELICTSVHTRLAPGDTLILYSDGITESMGTNGHEFGEPRLHRIAQANSRLSISGLVKAIMDAARSFAGTKPADDMTVVAARCIV
ncbi:MAG: PP2C family protein-serine/threonine phosphatase [Acidobacteriaceae bacterium]|nr:PP2C family protein-serine/threonine phosphatase [Acidobacteriaceae bacterium]